MKIKQPSFIQSIKREQPDLWQSILSASSEGLIVIDEASDSVSATNRLLLTYPGLHEVLAFITDQWAQNSNDIGENSALSLLLNEQKLN